MNSDKNTNSTPRLRFPGFTGEWEKKKLGEMANKINRRNHHLEVSRVLTNSANAGVVDQSDYFDRDIAVKENTANYHIVELEDFVYNPRISTAAPVGPISINKVGRGIMSPLYTVFRFHTGCISFYEQYFQTTIWHPYLKSIANFGARFDRMNITSERFFNMPLHLPSHAEQMKIAECLTAMDELITVQEQKVGTLKERKQGLMQQLFPQPGETSPRLRFPGFNGEWEEKKLGELAKISSGKSISSSEIKSNYTDGLYPCFGGNGIRGYASHYSYDGFYPIIGRVGALCGNVHLSQGKFYATEHALVVSLKTTDNPRYLEAILTHLNLRQYAKGLAQPVLAASTLSAISIPIPPREEQQKIADCLLEMDALIAAEATRMEALKAHKRGLMQQLFPQPSK